MWVLSFSARNYPLFEISARSESHSLTLLCEIIVDKIKSQIW